ncbi:MAG: type II toxin-antitoxin system HicA family toxin [Bacteroidota bacterium]
MPLIIKSSELFRLLKKNGWFEVRQNGSHVIMRHPTKQGSIPIPFHASKEVKKRLLNAILKQADIKTTKR